MHVRYPWHPLHGQVLDVCGSHAMAGERSYVVVLPDGSKTLLPVWMTEASAAVAVPLTTTPHVSVAALAHVRALMASSLDRRGRHPEADPRP